MKRRSARGIAWALPLCLVALSEAAPLRSASMKDFNVIIIDIDTLRADHVGSSSGRRSLTPNLDALASRSYVFADAISQAPWTLPATMSLFTSLYPHQHSLVNKYSVFTEDRRELARLPHRIVTLAQLFQRNGYDTAAFTGGAGLKGSFGFDAGFDVYFDSITFGGFDVTFPLAFDWLEKRQGRRHFLFVHGYDVHGQYPSHPEADAHRDEFMDLRMRTIKGEPIALSSAAVDAWRDRYDEKVVRADEAIGRFMRRLSTLPSAGRTMIVVVSDHGEQLYEHGGFDHGMTLYDENLRVPLIIHAPGAGAGRVDGQVRLIDVMPTLADWVGLAAGPDVRRQMRGTSLLPLMRSRRSRLDAYSETSFLLHTQKRSLRTADGWKLICDLDSLAVELYDLRRDPGETHDLAMAKEALAESLRRKVLRWDAAPDGSWRPAMLRAHRLAESGSREEAAEAVDGALEAVKRSLGGVPIVKDDPTSSLPSADAPWLTLGRILRREQYYAEAETALKDALALKPGDPAAWSELGRVYVGLGQDEKAVAAFGRALEHRPDDYGLLVEMAQCHVRLGRFDEARETYAKAKSLDRAQAEAYIETGYSEATAGNMEEARREFESIIALDTSSPVGYHHMGSLLARQPDRRAEAKAAFLRALELAERPGAPHGTWHQLHALDWLSQIARQDGDVQGAAALYRRGLSKAVESREYWHEVIFSSLLLDSHVERGELQEAEELDRRIRALCQAAQRCPPRTGLADLALLYLARDRESQARVLLDEIIRSAPRDSGRVEKLAAALVAHGMTREAEALRRRLPLPPPARSASRR